MEEISRPIDYVHAVRRDANVLQAFSHMRSLGRDYLSVIDSRETLVGVITREQITHFADNSEALLRAANERQLATYAPDADVNRAA
jgi:CBS-domain-containing membrane protein